SWLRPLQTKLAVAVNSLVERIRGLLHRRAAERRVKNRAEFHSTDGIESDFDDPFPDVVVIEFRDVIDLHSIPPARVKAVVEGYLQQARESGARRVRIIHGKGIGVQREMVRSILTRCSFVESFGDAPAEFGGWGATVVFVNADNREGN
ncbi:MAG: Smr/MutS family protein, partial [Blastocatellia bacterium]